MRSQISESATSASRFTRGFAHAWLAELGASGVWLVRSRRAFRPTEVAPVPETPYVVHGLDRGDAYLNRTPAECEPEILAAGRTPLTLEEGLHWALQDPDVLERNACFMTIGSRLRRANGSYDARTPALWLSNGTGRDGRERGDAPKLGWCWWGNRHTWLGIASASERLTV